MRHTAWLAVPIGLATALLHLSSSGAPFAKAPPALDDVVGTYALKARTTWITRDDGVLHRRTQPETWEVSADSDTVATVSVVGTELEFQAYFANGFLVWAYHDRFPFDQFGCMRFSGNPERPKLKGQVAWVGTNGDELEKLAGKRVQPPAPPGEPGATKDRAPRTPPGIDDLVGTYTVRVKGTLYGPTSGTVERGRDRYTVEISKVGDTEVSLNPSNSDSDLPGRYENGALIISVLDDETSASNALYARLLATGKPGRVRLAGEFISIESLGDPTDEVELGAMRAKQTGQ